MKTSRTLLFIVGVLLAAPGIRAADAAPTPTPTPYPLAAFSAIGSSFTEGNHLPELGWSDKQIEAFIDGVRASFHGNGFPFDETAKQVSSEMAKKVEAIMAKQMQQTFADPEQLKQYMKDACKKLNLEQADSGLCFGIEAGGHGNRPGPDDTVVVSCIATAADGTTKLPQLSYERSRVKVSSLLPGLREGLQMMTNSSRAIFVVPPALTYGSGDWPDGVDRGTPLIFQITLFSVESVPPKG